MSDAKEIELEKEKKGQGLEEKLRIALEKADCPIDVYVDSFIPFDRIENPSPVTIPPDTTYYHAFMGDGKYRGFIKGGSSRMYSSVVVDLCAENPLIIQSHDTGTTTGYRHVTITTRKVPWYDLFTAAFRIIEVSDSAKASTEDMEESVEKLDGCCVKIKIDGAASDPLITLSPDADYHYVVTLCCEESGQIKYKITGRHDGFPSFSIFIGPKLVYSFDGSANSIKRLWSSGDVVIDIKGTISTKCKCG